MNVLEQFAKALLAPGQPCPEGLFSHNGADPASRFAVYRNNVHSSLISALADGYPVTRQLVGDGFFRAMAGLYVQAYPPTSPLLNEYGSDLAAFIQGFAPAASVPYLADVARLEHLRINAYHAADTPVAEPQAVIDQLQQLPAWATYACTCTPASAPCSRTMPWWRYGPRIKPPTPSPASTPGRSKAR
jgi:hypothetical protein